MEVMICHCSQQSPTDLSKFMGTMPGTEIIEMEEVVFQIHTSELKETSTQFNEDSMLGEHLEQSKR